MITERVDRISPDDLTQLAFEVGPLPMHIGAVLVLDPVAPDDVVATLARRVTAIPRLRQRLVATPPGCGRPIWVDDGAFDIDNHVGTTVCRPPGDEEALLESAVAALTAPLPRDRPLWRAVVVGGLADGRTALVLVLHHALADGVGGLAALAGLVDGAPTPGSRPFPRAAPSGRVVAADAWAARARAVTKVPALLRSLPAAMAELGTRRPRATRCSLNQPVHPRLQLAAVAVELAPLRDAARSREATVNDAILTAVAGALGALLARRGEEVDSLVVSVAVAGRISSTPEKLGNRVGVMPVTVPARGNPWQRLERVAAMTRSRKVLLRGASASLSGPVFRALRAMGVLGWLIGRQRLVNTFVTSMRGPDRRPTFAGAVVADLIPLNTMSGNVTVAFTALSYAGTLTVTVAADPVACPDLEVVADELRRALEELSE